jgi:predicted RNase H-like HicB family nuclease
MEGEMMRLEGKIWKNARGRSWLVAVPFLDVMTQGHSKRDALRMIVDAIESLVDRKGFEVDVRPLGGSTFTVGANQGGVLVALMLKHQPELHLRPRGHARAASARSVGSRRLDRPKSLG